MPVYLFLLAYHNIEMLTFTEPHSYFNHYCTATTGKKEEARAALHLAPFHSISLAVSISNGHLVLNVMIHAMHEKTENRMGLQKSRYLPTSLTSFGSALSSVFVAFGSAESSRCFTGPSGHLTSPPEGISMCEQAQKERNEVHV